MAGTQAHIYDEVAQAVAAWVADMGTWLKEAMQDGGHSPFAAPITEQKKQDYYNAMIFNPDGSPNSSGRQELIDRLSLPVYARVYAQISDARQKKVGLAQDSVQPVDTGQEEANPPEVG